MTATWPTGVTQNMIAGSYSETPIRNVVSFQPDVGDAIERRRMSIVSDKIKFQSQLTLAERLTLKSFYRDDLKDGVLPFTRTNPKTSETITCKFDAEPNYADGFTDKFIVSLSLRVLP